MEFDPLARDVAPPRHEIESDSEDESSAASRPRKTFTPPRVQIAWHKEEAKTGSDLIIFLSEGGEAFLSAREDAWSEAAKVMINDEQVSARRGGSTEIRRSSLCLPLAWLFGLDRRQEKQNFTTSALDKSSQRSSKPQLHLLAYTKCSEAYNVSLA